MQIIKEILGLFVYGTWRRIKPFRKDSRCLWLDLREPEVVDRYLFNFVQQLNVRNPTYVVLPLTRKLLKSLFEGRNWRNYRRALMQTDRIYFQFSWQRNAKWKQTSTDYFEDGTSRRVKIPIGPHPTTFQALMSNSATARRRQYPVVFAGNTSRDYADFDSTLWGMPSRFETAEFLRSQGYERLFHSNLQTDEYVQLLSQAHFFLALPGLYMPFSHNLYESIFSGCIPIIHNNYRRMLEEPLRTILKPFGWDNHEELCTLILKIDSDSGRGNVEYLKHQTVLDVLAQFTYQYYYDSDRLAVVQDVEEICFCAGAKSISDFQARNC